jgi:hypothetical protein
MSARDYSVMPVLVVDGDGKPREDKPIERAVRRTGNSLNAGSYCDVEFGAVWATIQGRQERINGTWRQCLVVSHSGAVVHVRLTLPPSTAPFG